MSCDLTFIDSKLAQRSQNQITARAQFEILALCLEKSSFGFALTKSINDSKFAV